MRNHHFNNTDPAGPCQDVYDAVICGQAITSPVHSFVAGEFSHAEISVEVFINRDTTAGHNGQHYARVAWQREGNGAWYSAWFTPITPKDGSGVYHRVEKLDVLTVSMAALHITSLTENLTEADLIAMGITTHEEPVRDGTDWENRVSSIGYHETRDPRN